MTVLETVLIGCGAYLFGAVSCLFIAGKWFVFREECKANRSGCDKSTNLIDGEYRKGLDELSTAIKQIQERQKTQAQMMLLLMKELKISMDKQIEILT